MIEQTKTDIGRLAMRHEGDKWVAYYALTDTMDGAIILGTIAMAAVIERPARKEAFTALMRDVVADILHEKTGQHPTWSGEHPAPEHERAGTA